MDVRVITLQIYPHHCTRATCSILSWNCSNNSGSARNNMLFVGIIIGSYEFSLLDLRSNHQFYLIVFSLTQLYLHIPNVYQFGDHDHMDVIPKFSRSNYSLTFTIATIEEDPLIQTKYLPPTLGRSASTCKE